MKESIFQNNLIKRLEDEYPGCIILKNDPKYKQGIPDIIFLYYNFWALLECKKSEDAHKQPNQEWYVKVADKMCFSAFVYPENIEEVMYELQQAFRIRRKACYIKR